MRTFDLPLISNQKLKLTFSKLALSAILLTSGSSIFAQNVGINTTQPDASAALDIVGTDKGLLIPRVALQSLTDNTTVPNPATALLVYNSNAALGKAGFYYNSGTPANPSWSLVGAGSSLTLPFSQTANNFSSLFYINNTNGVGVGSAVTGESENSIGVKGQTTAGRGVVGLGTGSGTGVFAANTSSGLAMEVSGPVKIAGPGQSPGNGKVLTSDASGNATWQNISGDVAFRASGVLGGGSEVIPGDGTPVKVAFAGQNYDYGNNYNDANTSPHSTFIVPVAGLYHFDAQVSFKNPNEENGTSIPFEHSLNLVLVRDGNSTILVKNTGLMSFKASPQISTDLELLPDDKIHVEVWMTASNSSGKIGTNIHETFFSGRLLSKN